MSQLFIVFTILSFCTFEQPEYISITVQLGSKIGESLFFRTNECTETLSPIANLGPNSPFEGCSNPALAKSTSSRITSHLDAEGNVGDSMSKTGACGTSLQNNKSEGVSPVTEEVLERYAINTKSQLSTHF